MSDLVSALNPLTSRVRTDISAAKINGNTFRTNEPITPALLAIHLNGGPARGVYPIIPGTSVTKVAMFDLDSHKGETAWEAMVEIAQRIMAELERHGMKPNPFRSSGGKGIHLYLLWDEPQDAYSVRQFLDETLDTLGYKNGTAGVAKGEIEIFPKQNKVPPGRFGNMFFLPLAGESVPLEPLLGLEPMEKGHIATNDWWQISPAVPILLPVSPVELVRSEGCAPDLEKIREPLAFINPDCSRDDWIKVGMALHHETAGGDDGLALWDEWSSGALKREGPKSAASYQGFDDVEYQWKSIRGDAAQPVTIGTIKTLAREAGWVEDVLADFEIVHLAETIRNRFKVIPADEFANGKPQRWRIKNILPETGLAMIFGESGTGKSFFALDIIAAIARGKNWREHKVKKAKVIYVAAEGAGGFRKRLRAYAKQHDTALADVDLHIIQDVPNIHAEDTQPLINAIRQAGGAGVIVFDTLAQVTAGANENAGEDMGKVLSRCQLIAQEFNALVIIIHHSGKDATRGSRGWSGLKAPLDTEIAISKDGNRRLATITKQKDGEDGRTFAFQLKPVSLEMDDDGDVITSCVVEHLDNSAAKIIEPQGRWQKLVYKTTNDLIGLAGESATVKQVITEAIRGVAHDPGPDPEKPKRDSRRDSAKRAMNELTDEGLIILDGDKVMLPQFRKSSQNDICEIAATADSLPQIPQHPIRVRE